MKCSSVSCLAVEFLSMPQVQKRHQAKIRSCTMLMWKGLRVPMGVARCALRKRGMEEWLIRTVMALYTGDGTVGRKNAGLSKTFKVRVGLHKESVLSLLLFAVVMDVVSSEARNGPSSELLHADDMVLIVPTMEQLGRRVAKWRLSLLDKGLKVMQEV